MSYSKSLANCIDAYLRKEGIRFHFDEEDGEFLAKWNLSKDSILLNKITVSIDVADDEFLVKALAPVHTPETKLNEMAKYLSKVNYPLKNGCFKLDYRDGEVCYELNYFCPDQIPSEDAIKRAIMIPLSMFKQYGANILDIMTGNKSADDAASDGMDDILEKLKILSDLLGSDDSDD